MQMIKIVRTDSDNQDFRQLVVLLDRELKDRDGDDHSFFAQFNKIDKIKYALVAYLNDVPCACGAIKEYDNDTMEIKRMYVIQEKRGKGIAGMILQELENWTKELNFKRCILETGKKQPEAIRLYSKSGYRVIPNYGQYENVSNSVCFEKIINQK